MIAIRAALLAGAASLSPLLALPATAQTTPADAPAAEAPAGDEVVVTGTRAPGRSRLDTV